MSKKKIKVAISIEIKNIEVDDEYYGFDYIVKSDCGIDKKDRYESDYENGMSKKEWKEVLVEGEALKYVLQELSN